MLWLFVILALLLLWAIPAFRTLQEMEGQPAPRWRIPLLHLIDEPEEAAVVFVLLGIGIAVGGYAFLYGLGTLRDMVGDFYGTRKAMVATGPIRIKERQTTPSGHTATSPVKKSANWFVSGLPIQAFGGDGWT